MTRAAVLGALACAVLLLGAACAPREGSVSGAYVGGAAGANLRPDSR